MNIDTIRRQAHRAASQQGDGNVNYNPFARTRSRDSTADIENPVHRTRSTRSEAAVSTIEEQQRLESSKAAEKEFGGQHHHNTEPTPTSPTSHDGFATIPGSSSEKHADAIPETNGHVKDSTDSTMASSDHDHTTGVTKRARFKGVFRKDHNGGEESELTHVESDQMSLEERKKRAHKRKIPVMQQVKFVLFGAWINVLLIMVPVGFAVFYAHLAPVPVFVVNFIAIIPLAAMLSTATEELAIRVGETLGGLLNATFGNAVELIVSVQALLKDEITIVKTSLIGSMLSNLLLVLGMSFFLGGINRVEQFFNVTVAQTAASLLALCIGSLIIPTVFHNSIAEDKDDDGDTKRNDALSRGTAIILLFVYACYLTFQLKTHATMYNAPSQKVEKRKSSKRSEGDAARGIAAIGAGTAAASGGGVNVKSLFKNPDADHADNQEEEEFETPSLSVIGALITLGISTTLVAFCSEFMVESINGLTDTGAVSKVFVGLILLPIVGNAAEHATAVTVAIKDKMDLSIGVAVGSSMQIALLVFPLIVILGWILGKDCMTLYFDTFQIATLFVSVLLVNYLIQDGKSHWLEGILLMSSYIIIALAAWFYPNPESETC
ncbi:vacuolar calcium ion transporter-like protein /H(+) exchanger [Ophiobolus disseminans]|uniref:Vacuolar calcium ion transporter-like protein /H(+) exchanger n=1 Tax=Ophiobolus disseminans TaxID=1469910 RepID=A0A6A7A8E3_9PLEO|nr:vacuolar calcium ion transporter-like protein /H(+) exchanger [Ophiobolus disseminans]